MDKPIATTDQFGCSSDCYGIEPDGEPCKIHSTIQPTKGHMRTSWKIFKSEYGIGLRKDNSDTRIFYFKTVEEAIAKLADIAPDQIIHAVNCQEDFVERLIGSYQELHDWYEHPGTFFNCYSKLCFERRQAIATAEGK